MRFQERRLQLNRKRYAERELGRRLNLSKESSLHETDPRHPILPDAWRYEITGLHLELAAEDGTEPFLDLTLRRGDDIRRLRFYSPQDLEIERGGPISGGLTILDVRSRELDRLGVRVDDFEASPGSLRFWARDVEDVTSRVIAPPA